MFFLFLSSSFSSSTSPISSCRLSLFPFFVFLTVNYIVTSLHQQFRSASEYSWPCSTTENQLMFWTVMATAIASDRKNIQQTVNCLSVVKGVLELEHIRFRQHTPQKLTCENCMKQAQKQRLPADKRAWPGHDYMYRRSEGGWESEKNVHSEKMIFSLPECHTGRRLLTCPR